MNKILTLFTFLTILITIIFNWNISNAQQEAINANPIESATVNKIKKNCVGTADPKDKSKDIQMKRTDFINTTTKVKGGGTKTLNCKAGLCPGAAKDKCYVDMAYKFQPKQRMCCEKFARGSSGKMECDPGKEPVISTDQVNSQLRKFVACNDPKINEALKSLEEPNSKKSSVDELFNSMGPDAKKLFCERVLSLGMGNSNCGLY